MSARNVWRRWVSAAISSETIDIASGQSMNLLPSVDNQGAVNIGNGTRDMDFKVFLGASTDFALFDISLGKIFIDNAELNFGDADELEFGDATNGDVTIAFDGTSTLNVLAASADDLVINFGNGTNNFDVRIYGEIPTSYIETDASQDLIRFRGPIRTDGVRTCLPRRYELVQIFGMRGRPQLNADILSATEATRETADPSFEVLGVNSTSALSTYGVEGGITLTTAGADGDEMIILPHLDVNQTSWASTTWGTDRETHWECHIATAANVTNTIIWAGLKLTNAEAVSTDDNAVWFRYEDDVASGSWQAAASIATVDSVVNSAAAVAINTVYHLKIVIASDRTAQMYLNGALIRTTAALTNAVDLIPYIGVACDGATAAKALNVYSQSISRLVQA